MRDGAYKPFKGLLPYGITTAGTRAEVCSKLGVQPISATPYEGYPDKNTRSSWEEYPTWWDKYIVPPFSITVIFKSPAGDMDMIGFNSLMEKFDTLPKRMPDEQSEDRDVTNNQAVRRSPRRRSATRHRKSETQ